MGTHGLTCFSCECFQQIPRIEKHDAPDNPNAVKSDDENNQSGGKKPMWVTIFRCFHCGKHGHNLPKCRQCAQAYYCDADCQRKYWVAFKTGK